ncbi:MAG: bifunctional UDP-N-acetylglucosamine diphosphorylase/glucosamine-1-phosphate N-acetyltransferase GlmU [Kiloniellales bacterium]
MTHSKSSERPLAAVVLAAGKGTRMESALPKVLHPIAGRPMLLHLLDALAPIGAEPTVVVIGPGMEAVAEVAAPRPCVVQKRQAGTANAVMAARGALEGFAGDVLVLYADTPLIRTGTLKTLLAARRRPPEAAVAVLGFRPPEPGEYGRLKLGRDGTLERIIEPRDATPAELAIELCNAGVMAVDGAQLFALLERVGNDNAKGEYYLTDMVALARAEGLACAVVEGDADELIGVNGRADLARAEAIMQRRLRDAAMAGGATLTDPSCVWLAADTRLGRDVVVGPNVVFGPGVTVDQGAEIRAFCHLEGVHLHAGAVIGPFARLRPGSVIGAGARVGNFVEVKNATLEEGVKANHLSYVGDARVGAKANIGAGTITCNYDGFHKHRTEIGAGAFIGSNSALVAPVSIGDGAIVGAGSVVTRDVAADALATARAPQQETPGAARRRRKRKAAGKSSERA